MRRATAYEVDLIATMSKTGGYKACFLTDPLAINTVTLL
jgi:hypothetical protein